MQQESKVHRLWTLFSSMLLISTFTFGGGFVIVSLMKKKFVDELHYLTEEEMLDMTALAQTAPGAIAVNGAILVGRRIAGIPGLIVAVLATILPPIVIISVISMMYAAFAENEWVRAVLTGMQSGVAAVICDVTANLGGKVVQSKDWLNLLLMAGAFVASAVFHINVIVVILVAAAIGVIRALLARRGAYPHDGAVPRLFQIGLFSVGGGYAAMPLIQSLVVESHGWLTMAEFTNLMTIAEMTPGPIAVNSATFVGMRCAGLPGALVATFGCIAPSLILVTLLSYLYGRFRSGQTMQNVLGALRPVVVALIASAALSIVQVAAVKSGGGVSIVGIVLMVAAFLVLRWKKWNPILVMLLCGIGGAAAHAVGWL